MSDDLGPWPEKVYLLHPSVKTFGDMVTYPERREYVLADRIEQLINENYQLIASLEMCNFAWDQALHQRDEAEAKLAKAVDALPKLHAVLDILLNNFPTKARPKWVADTERNVDQAIAVLAELEGKE